MGRPWRPTKTFAAQRPKGGGRPGLPTRPSCSRCASRQPAHKFNELWKEHAVRRSEASRKRFRHPGAGRIDLDYIKLSAADNDQQQLVAFLPADPDSAGKLAGLC
jgi:hypothetical protein